MKKVVLICVALFQFFFSSTFAQNESLFLLMPTNAEMTGMGYASVAHMTNNPAAFTTNPSQVGMQCLDNEVASFSTNHSQWLSFFYPEMKTRTLSAMAGIPLKKYFPNLPPLSLGVSYANTHINKGLDGLIYTTNIIPPPLGVFNAFEESNQFTLSIAADYYVRASIGMTYKHITAALINVALANKGEKADGSASLYDIGFLIDVPVVSILSKLTDKQITITPNIAPLCNFSVGISKSNLGDESLSHTADTRYDFMPRYARAGIEGAVGLQYNFNNVAWIPVSFKWTVEANDLLANYTMSGSEIYKTNYTSGLGDINFFKEVILGKSNDKTEKLKGWELNLAEIVYLYGGKHEASPGTAFETFTTDGYAIRLTGMLKAIAFIAPGAVESGFLKYVLNHVDIKFTESTITSDVTLFRVPMNNTKYYSFNVSWSNWSI